MEIESTLTRREALQGMVGAAAAAASAPVFAGLAAAPVSGDSTTRWDSIELRFAGPSSGNPFVDVHLAATFRCKNRSLTVEGFYDGEGAYKIRFMPDELGEWTWTTGSNAPALDGKSGAFQCMAPGSGNRGPVSVRDGYHFGYADGTPYVECGTTCYAWAFQAEATQRQTIETLSASPFNKLRMCIFPKWYQHNRKEPPMYPVSAQRRDERLLDLQRRVLPALRSPHPRVCAASASRPISSSSIPTTSGAISRCPPRSTTAICATSLRASALIATCGGRWPTNTTC